MDSMYSPSQLEMLPGFMTLQQDSGMNVDLFLCLSPVIMEGIEPIATLISMENISLVIVQMERFTNGISILMTITMVK